MSKAVDIGKTITQIVLYFIEIAVVVLICVLLSSKLWPISTGLAAIERVALFYGLYQLTAYVILSMLNDMEADEFLALKCCAEIALMACEEDDQAGKDQAFTLIEIQTSGMLLNREKIPMLYMGLKPLIESDDRYQIRKVIQWAGHCYESCRLQYRCSFFLRWFKEKR